MPNSLVAITNPTVNSYKRINAPRTLSGATWSPNTVTFGGNNRTHMVRVPDEGRIEFRLPDGAANPYLMMAGILAAGLHGIDEKMDPGKRLDIDMYAEGHKVKDAKKLPLNLLDAIRNFEKDKYLARRARGGCLRRLYQAQDTMTGTSIAATSPSGSATRRSIARPCSHAIGLVLVGLV